VLRRLSRYFGAVITIRTNHRVTQCYTQLVLVYRGVLRRVWVLILCETLWQYSLIRRIYQYFGMVKTIRINHRVAQCYTQCYAEFGVISSVKFCG